MEKDLIYDFDCDAKLEIVVERGDGKTFIEVAPYIFRSWAGKRFINDKEFYGKVFALNSNEEIKIKE